MGVTDFVPTKIWTISQEFTGNAVFLRPENSHIVLPVFVTENDIQTILIELTHVLAPRPMVHELLLSAIEALEGRLLRAEIYACKRGSYLCSLVIEQNNKEVYLESRPSDILCIAARADCPVYVESSILSKNGLPADRVTSNQENNKGVREPASVVSFLKKELQSAVDQEEFERAAHLRDRLEELSQQL